MTMRIPTEHAVDVDDQEAQISEPGHGPLGLQARPENNTGWLWSVVNLTLGTNQSDPFWRLTLLAAINLVVTAMIGVFFLPNDLHGVHATYHRVMLMMTVGAPIVVAMITFLASIWLAQDRDRRINWITGLSVANASMLAGSLVVYWVLSLGTRTK